MNDIQFCIVTVDGTSLCRCVDMMATEDALMKTIDEIRIQHVVEARSVEDTATGVYVCINQEGKPKKMRFFRFIANALIEEEIQNEVFVRNIMFRDRLSVSLT